eukprot:TRINITY_DN17687_c0_g1_i3.p1 TRINITY_DN17687_c0_g1~~TRINITY_DN17687_c0_g1_i3.p1  ORF type:complete len:151 (+),score=15.79 TRINITY_DN17687_c0_g1_i3:431-883(+)
MKNARMIKNYVKPVRLFNQELENYVKQKEKVPVNKASRERNLHGKQTVKKKEVLKLSNLNTRKTSVTRHIEAVKKDCKLKEQLLRPVLQSQRENYFGRCCTKKMPISKTARKRKCNSVNVVMALYIFEIFTHWHIAVSYTHLTLPTICSV